MPRDDIFASADVLDELLPWSLGEWRSQLLPWSLNKRCSQTPPYAGFCDLKAVAVPLNRLLRILLDERPWSQHLNDMDAADAVRSWLSGVLRNLALRRRVSKAWAAAGQRCFDALVAEIRHRAAAAAGAIQAFLDEQPKLYPGELPPGSWLDESRDYLVSPWSKDPSSAKHLPLLQALFEHCFHQQAGASGTAPNSLYQSEAYAATYSGHSVWPRNWLWLLRDLAVPVHERELWDTLHRRCRCCPRGSRCCLQADREQVLRRGGGDGYGSDSRREQLGPWLEADADQPSLVRVGRSELPKYVAITTAPVETVSMRVLARPDGTPCMKCNPCDRVSLPYTHRESAVMVCIEVRNKAGDLGYWVKATAPGAVGSSNESLMTMLIENGAAVRGSKWDVAMRSLYRRRELALLAAPGPRQPCKCYVSDDDKERSMLKIWLPPFHVEDRVDNSWASLLGLDRAGLFREAVQWPRLATGCPILVEYWRRLELTRRVALLGETLPGRFNDWSILKRSLQKIILPTTARDHRKQCACVVAAENQDHLWLYKPLRPLLEHVHADPAAATKLGAMAATRYDATFGTDAAMVEFFECVECVMGPALKYLARVTNGIYNYQRFGEQRAVLRRIASDYAEATRDCPFTPPLSSDDRIKAIASQPASAPTHPRLLLRWFLAATCANQEEPWRRSLEVHNVIWMPAGGRFDAPPSEIPCSEVVVRLSLMETNEGSSFPRFMRFAFALRMSDFCVALGQLAGALTDAELSRQAWQVQAKNQLQTFVETGPRTIVAKLSLIERVLKLPWVPIFPDDPIEGTRGACALPSKPHTRGGWFGDVRPKGECAM